VTQDQSEQIWNSLLREISRTVQSQLSEIRGTADVRDNLGSVRTEIRLLPRREALDFYGLSEQEAAAQILYAMSDSEVGKFSVGGLEDDLSIRLGTAWPSRRGKQGGPTRMDELATIRLVDPSGATVPILTVMEPRLDSTPVSITHLDTRRAITVMAKTAGSSTGEILEEMTPVMETLRTEWPAGYSYRFTGEAEETAETFASAGLMLGVALALVFAILVLLFGSFSQSFILLLTIPSPIRCGARSATPSFSASPPQR
jgi:multidrug efflux pump subunit AcrB